MELIEESIVALTLLLIRKLKIERKLRQTFKCILRKLFFICGMKTLENELIYLNESIKNLQTKKKGIKKIKRYSSI